MAPEGDSQNTRTQLEVPPYRPLAHSKLLPRRRNRLATQCQVTSCSCKAISLDTEQPPRPHMTSQMPTSCRALDVEDELAPERAHLVGLIILTGRSLRLLTRSLCRSGEALDSQRYRRSWVPDAWNTFKEYRHQRFCTAKGCARTWFRSPGSFNLCGTKSWFKTRTWFFCNPRACRTRKKAYGKFIEALQSNDWSTMESTTK